MRNFNSIKWLVALAGLLVVGCSEDETPVTPPKNQSPTIAFTFAKLAVARSSDVILTVDVDDPDGDPVQVTWAVTRGLLEPADQGTPTMQWSTPGTVGTDTVTVTAADGKGGMRELKEVLLVGTERSADVSLSNQTWGIAGSPYLLSPPREIFAVTETATLTIEAGVELFVEPRDPPLQLQVNGTLVIAGTETAPVFVRPNARAPEPGFWAGILATPAAGPPVLDIDHADISYAASALRTSVGGNIFVTNCHITFCSWAGVLHGSNGRLVVEDCTITDNLKSGVRVEESTIPPESIVIRRNDIELNGRFKESTVYTEGEAGISIDLNDPAGTVPIEISGNEISRNDFPGIRLIRPAFPQINNNGIFGNEFRLPTHINIRLEPPFSGLIPTIDATNNFWGINPSDSLVIKQGIFDSEDDLSVQVKVLVTPWLGSWP